MLSRSRGSGRSDLPAKKTLKDSEIAEMILYYMKGDAEEIQAQLGQTSNVSVHLSKLKGIFEMAERTRSLEAEEPYDAVDLIKGTLEGVRKGDNTLEDGFYKGKGGEDSIFIGAPSQKHSRSRIGGSAVLRNPLGYDDRLERQMEVFPTNKGEFKEFVNENRGMKRKLSDDVVSQEELDQLEEEEKAEPAAKRRRVTAAKEAPKKKKTVRAKKTTVRTKKTSQRKTTTRRKGSTTK